MPTTMMTQIPGESRVAATSAGDCVDCLDDLADEAWCQMDIAITADDDEFAGLIASLEAEFDAEFDVDPSVNEATTWRMSPTGQVRHVCTRHAAQHDEAAELDDDAELLALATAIGLVEAVAA